MSKHERAVRRSGASTRGPALGWSMGRKENSADRSVNPIAIGLIMIGNDYYSNLPRLMVINSG